MNFFAKIVKIRGIFVPLKAITQQVNENEDENEDRDV